MSSQHVHDNTIHDDSTRRTDMPPSEDPFVCPPNSPIYGILNTSGSPGPCPRGPRQDGSQVTNDTQSDGTALDNVSNYLETIVTKIKHLTYINDNKLTKLLL